MNTNRISILGCGWLGTPLAEFLISKGFEVKGSTTSESKLDALKSKGIEEFLIDKDKNASRFFQSDILIITIPPKSGQEYLTLMESFVDAIERSEIKKVIFISSTSVYDQIDGLFDEEFLCETESENVQNLLDVEELLFQSETFETCIIRFGGLIGKDRHPGTFLTGKMNVKAPESPVNMIVQEDCIHIIHTVIQKDFFDEVLNAVADTHPTKEEFYTKAAETLGASGLNFDHTDKGIQRIISNEKLKKELGYKLIYPDLMKWLDTI